LSIEIELTHDASGISKIALNASEEAVDGRFVDGSADDPTASMPNDCAPANDRERELRGRVSRGNAEAGSVNLELIFGDACQ
jgi:hypothetical protein